MKPIDTLQDLTKKIFEVTVKIQTLYPESYFLLNETLLFITQNEKYITTKTELIYGNKLSTKEKMELEIFEYIEVWYNKKRRHSTLNYQTIEEFNNQNKIYQNVA